MFTHPALCGVSFFMEVLAGFKTCRNFSVYQVEIKDWLFFFATLLLCDLCLKPMHNIQKPS